VATTDKSRRQQTNALLSANPQRESHMGISLVQGQASFGSATAATARPYRGFSSNGSVKGYTRFVGNERQYNLKARVVNFVEGQEVFRRNFKQSNFAEGYNAKLGPRFLKARVREKLGDTYYALEDMQGKFLAKYHDKDNRRQ